MALAETIDIVFLGTFSPVEENSIGCTRFAAWYSEAYRPKAMPVPAFQGLNRALPLKQACKPYGAFACSVLWSQSDTDTMIRVVRKNETKAYNHSRTHKIQWSVLIRLLHEEEIASLRAQPSSLTRRTWTPFAHKAPTQRPPLCVIQASRFGYPASAYLPIIPLVHLICVAALPKIQCSMR